MTFVWPSLLWVLAVLPGLAAVIVQLLHQRRPVAAGFASRPALRAGWQRYVPPGVLMLAFATLVIATARPTATMTVMGPRSTIILAMDVSQSMAAQDVEPSRLVASQQAAKQFVAQQPGNVEVGIVAFAGIAFVAQPPTTNHAILYDAIDRLELLRSTAVGSGILASLETIFPDIDLSTALYGNSQASRSPRAGQRVTVGALGTTAPSQDVPDPIAAEVIGPGSYESAIVILMTDGATTVGPDPRRAGQLAADLGVRVFTVAFGTETGAKVSVNGRSINASVDEPTLRYIAEQTGADYFRATSAAELARIYSTMSTRFVGETEEVELAFLFAGIGALLALVAGFLSLWWFGRVA